ncbi:Vps62-related protein [Neobacillus soli]|uniref:Vps62-related protein n=1 Tax=Neobacillus soli TaxID=220688 RepID=UPI0008248A08|nr:Vps62-related protein [Neobacillus soli]
MTSDQAVSTVQLSEVRFGDLIISFTGMFAFRWNDKGSGGKHDVSFFHPVCKNGFFPLGSVGVGGYYDINNGMAVMCVKAAPGTNALAHPVDYIYIWNDSRSGSKMDGSCWRPVPPQGYVSLGDVFVGNHNKPSLKDVVCVRSDLTYSGIVGDWIYDDSGSGAREDFSAHKICVSGQLYDQDFGLFAPGTFIGNRNHAKPQTVPSVLRLPLPTTKFNDSLAPILNGKHSPTKSTPPVLDREVIIPMTSVNDNEFPISWKLQNSPFYYMQRENFYTLLAFQDNETSDKGTLKYQYESGIEKENSKTWSKKTGISISAESGFSLFGGEGKISCTVNSELGFEESNTVREFTNETISSEIPVSAKTAVGIWSSSYNIKVLRGDRSQIGPALMLKTPSVAISQYPNLTVSIVQHDEFNNRKKHKH